jgi:hypothetical protein
MMLLVALSTNVDRRAVGILRRLDDVEVAEDSPQTVVVTEDDAFPARLEVVEADQIESRLVPSTDDRARLFIVNAVLDDDSAAKLEDAGVNYIDAAGRRWLRGWARTRRASEPMAGARRRLYAPSVRLAQLLADHPAEPWTERGLAKRGHTTQATAHRLLARLEREDLVEREGRGPRSMRRVRDPLAMPAWLAREGRPRRVARLSCVVAEPDHPRQVAGRALALTGAAAAAAIGFPVLTQSVRPAMRVDVAADELEDIPEALGGFRTEAGANLTLIADPDRLAFVDASRGPGGGLIAPPSRIMLDLYLESRGEAAVDVFLDLWGRGKLA